MEADMSPNRPDHSAVAAAFERRLQAEREAAQAAQGNQAKSFEGDHERRQEFRRMVDPGILRPNPRHVALESLQTLLKLAENIINSPEEAKYQRFKPTNGTIKRTLVDPKGTLEYAVAMGFQPQVDNFQPFYVWSKRHATDLRIGAAIIREALERETTKEEVVARKRAEEKAAHEAAVAKVKQAFYDDRKGRAVVDERERVVRAAQEARRAAGELPEPSTRGGPAGRGRGGGRGRAKRSMPGAGQTLSGEIVPAEKDASEGEDHDGDQDGDEYEDAGDGDDAESLARTDKSEGEGEKE